MQPFLKRKKAILLLSFLALGLATIIYVRFFTGPSDAYIEGARLSEHLIEAFNPAYQPFGRLLPGRDPEKRQRSIEAFEKAPAEKCAFLLLAWIEYQETAWRPYLARKARQWGYPIRRLEVDYRSTALRALWHRPVESAALVEPLMRLLTNQEPSYYYPPTPSHALGILEKMLATNLKCDREEIAGRFVALAEEFAARPANPYDPFSNMVSALERCVRLCKPEEGEYNLLLIRCASEPRKAGAAWALGESGQIPEKAVPVLIECLSSTNKALVERSAQALGKYGAVAKAALPKLAELVSHKSRLVRSAASNAVIQIEIGLRAGGAP